jgi:hypothetical protein
LIVREEHSVLKFGMGIVSVSSSLLGKSILY